MKKIINRRDFLKMSALATAGTMSLFEKPAMRKLRGPKGENILIILFDTLSAENLSLYGYPRKTTPILERIAERGTVYHNHFAGGPFTTPGTASLLTGSYPWTHRAFKVQSRVTKEFEQKNLFSLFEDYHRIAYTHNPVANTILRQFLASVDSYIPIEQLYMLEDWWLEKVLINDFDTAWIFKQQLFENMDGIYNSLFLQKLMANKSSFAAQMTDLEKEYKNLFPRGLPGKLNHFILEDGIDAIQGHLSQIDEPFLGYYHFFPPHVPYNTRREFFNVFNGDGIEQKKKPEHLFSRNVSLKSLRKNRRYYDEFILYVDHEFGRLFDYLESSGILENTWVIFTSDHGEMFERGIRGHLNPSLHQPVIHVPLVIWEPGKRERRDIYESTSCVDLIPTFLHVTGHDIPEWLEGNILPPYAETPPEREIFALQARHQPPNKTLDAGTAMMVKGDYKLTKYFGYERLINKHNGEPFYELYNIRKDPQELSNLSIKNKSVFKRLKDILNKKLDEVNAPFRS